MIFQLADSEVPDQTARIDRLIWPFTIPICPKTGFRIAQFMICITFIRDIEETHVKTRLLTLDVAKNKDDEDHKEKKDEPEKLQTFYNAQCRSSFHLQVSIKVCFQ